MKFARITTPRRPVNLAANVAVEELDLGGGSFCRVVLTRGLADPRTLAEHQANVENLVTITKKAVQIDADGNLVDYGPGLPSATRTTSETVDLTGIGDTHTWRPAWVRVPTPAGETWAPGTLPPDVAIAAALPLEGVPGQRLYVDPFVYAWSEGLLAAMADAKGEELLRILRNSAQLAGGF